jgi:hypothetical protein
VREEVGRREDGYRDDRYREGSCIAMGMDTDYQDYRRRDGKISGYRTLVVPMGGDSGRELGVGYDSRRYRPRDRDYGGW